VQQAAVVQVDTELPQVLVFPRVHQLQSQLAAVVMAEALAERVVIVVQRLVFLQ
jgi:hypothetical protein